MAAEDNARNGWHASESAAVLEHLETHVDGLSRDAAAERLARHGPNRLRPPRRHGPFVRFLLQFHNVLIYVLIAAAVVTALLGHWVDTGVILGVVVINAVIGVLQEGKAERALDAIRDMLSPQATAIRDGRRITVPAEELVPGDVVVLQSGDKVPADLRLLRVRELRVDEAVLTGESVAVDKHADPVPADAVLGDRLNMAFSGTLVAYGQATGVVTATGDHTEIGRISSMLADVEKLTTPLLREIAVFGRWLAGAILVAAALTFLFGLAFRDYAWGEIFLAAVGLAVAAIPEGLPAIMTITLAIGVQRMAGRNAIIRKLPAVETLGSVTVICSDKTGTLTRNEMTVQAVATAEADYAVSGVGYAPEGAVERDGAPVDPEAEVVLAELLRVALLCNDAVVGRQEGDWRMEGDPTEGALMTLALKGGLDAAELHAEQPRTDAIPFESEHRFMATLHHDHHGAGVIYLKGAPERVLEMCSRQRTADGDVAIDPDHWRGVMDGLADRGQRVLALAARPADPGQQELAFEHVDEGLVLLGLVGIIDPPREEAIAAVRQCQEAGIRTKMITGDHALTARAIGRELGIGDGSRVLTGGDVEAMDDAALERAVAETDVFARASPEHKLRLVQALQASGERVAMTGDGVNDAPALKRADVGVAMGLKGTEVSKEASDMVLADDNFASIARAVEEGRTVYDNLRKALLFLLPTNGGQALVVIAAVLAGLLLPISPVQILWVNMVTAVTLGLALAFEPTEPGVMARPPRAPTEPILSGFLVWRVAFVSVLLVTATFGLFLFAHTDDAAMEYARTVAVNTLVVCQIFYLVSARFVRRPALAAGLMRGNPWVPGSIAAIVVLQLLFTYAPPLQLLFGSQALAFADWLRILGAGLAVFLLVELEKWLLTPERGGRAPEMASTTR
ncbi:cation-transporting P-type ATPase [Aquisalimonas asiatica]|uniref:ATPase, P-type (Transporting), HAD superfamily, subfamily IC n=1 Tax=Aquisalimonas asiatica TaxID=406100 RepID=A0A1H8VFM6_9GAMM|nr:cation-transporting P-type ATPase [Aquisalimonas asiatica]SEP14007.1 ATPase, P-type (transporting), HAD superfamily, subfamily IC [Aquisalimonas asiatica]